jgi:hypothetical protein
MKRYALFSISFLCCFVSAAQTEFISKPYSFNIGKSVTPPLLSLVEGSLSFQDSDGNGVINSNEKCSVKFEIGNSGSGDGLNLKAKVSVTGNTGGLEKNIEIDIPNALKGVSTEYKIPITADFNTEDGKVFIRIEIIEPNDFSPAPFDLTVSTKGFVAPRIQIVDYSVSASSSGQLKLKKTEPFKLKLLIQNTGLGVARNIRGSLILHEKVIELNDKLTYSVDQLLPGDIDTLIYDLIIKSSYESSSLLLEFKLLESMGKYSSNWSKTFNLEQVLELEHLVVAATEADKEEIKAASFRSDVDREIPFGIPVRDNRYALIIGNEDYASKQLGIGKESNAEYASNDATMFAAYAEKVLGYPKDNIRLLLNATKGTMSQSVDWLVKKSQAQGDAEIIFYYSGHGLPEESSRVPYLIPVDVSGAQVQNGISLIEVYEKLASSQSLKCTVILDACFSGGARNKELAELKGIKVKSSIDKVPGNLMVLSSSLGTQSSAVYKEMQHGYFTYFLLKSLKEDKGKGSISNTMKVVSKAVQLEALDIDKEQTPQLIPGSELLNWEDIKW